MKTKNQEGEDLFQKNFEEDLRKNAPLADRMRPEKLEDYRGQEDILGKGKALRRQIENDLLTSLILWGPPGSGKTTLAKVIARQTKYDFLALSAIGWTTKSFREKIAQVLEKRKLEGRRTILFVDEIHRLNKAQQDQLLPYLEKGVVTLIGATTENPSFELNAAILSRCQVYVLERLSGEILGEMAQQALQDTNRGLGKMKVKIESRALAKLSNLANGDARILYNILERAALAVGEGGKISEGVLKEVVSGIALVYDKGGEEHYNLISALHKSMRDGDGNAALYWLARMLAGGEDPLYIARRVLRFASEDVGMADERAILVCVAAREAVSFLGMPEAETALGQAVLYCARAPKSNEVYRALGEIKAEIKKSGNLPVPKHLRNAPTQLMRDLDYGKDYKYFHEDPKGAKKQEHLPKELKGKKWVKN